MFVHTHVTLFCSFPSRVVGIMAATKAVCWGHVKCTLVGHYNNNNTTQTQEQEGMATTSVRGTDHHMRAVVGLQPIRAKQSFFTAVRLCVYFQRL